MHNVYNLNMMNNIKLVIYRHDFLFNNIRFYIEIIKRSIKLDN